MKSLLLPQASHHSDTHVVHLRTTEPHAGLQKILESHIAQPKALGLHLTLPPHSSLLQHLSTLRNHLLLGQTTYGTIHLELHGDHYMKSLFVSQHTEHEFPRTHNYIQHELRRKFLQLKSHAQISVLSLNLPSLINKKKCSHSVPLKLTPTSHQDESRQTLPL